MNSLKNATRHWRVKAAAQGAFSLLPDPQRINQIAQRYITRTAELSDDHYVDKRGNAALHETTIPHRLGDRAALRSLELGTGWYPVTPLVLWLGGVGDVHTIDIQDLWSPRRAGQVAARLLAESATWDAVDESRVDRLQWVLDAGDGELTSHVLSHNGFHCHVGDAAKAPLDAGSVDLFTSNATLEHVPGVEIERIFTGFAQLAANGSWMSHYIDLADHYAYIDPSITFYNFLQYSDSQWVRYNNSLHYQNRLRIDDYERIHETTGWVVMGREVTRGDERELDGLVLADQYAARDPKTLLVKHAHLTSTRHYG